MSGLRVNIELDEVKFIEACHELKLTAIPTCTLNGSERVNPEKNNGRFKRIRGLYEPAWNHITVATLGESYEKEGIYVLTKHIRFTFLHEMRHAHQRFHWTDEMLFWDGDYDRDPKEIDANAWADYASPNYVGIVRVTRQRVGTSGFGRMNERATR